MKNNKVIRNFMYFGHNYPNDFISQVWDNRMADHLQSKFNSLYERKGTLTFFSWFMELDINNQTTLTEWIEKNYTN